MAISRLQKIFILGHRSIEKELIEYIYKLGVIEIIPDKEKDSERFAQEKEKVAVLLDKIRFVLNFLTLHITTPLKEKYQNKITDEAIDIEKLYDKCKEFEKKLASLREKENYLAKECNSLLPFKDVNLDITGLSSVEIKFFRIPHNKYLPLKEELLKLSLIDVYPTYKCKGYVYFIMVTHSSIKKDVEKILNKFPAEEVKIVTEEGKISEIYKEKGKQLDALREEMKIIEDEIEKYGKYISELEKSYLRYYNIFVKYDGWSKCFSARDYFYITGWIREKDVKMFVEKMKSRFSEVEIEHYKPVGEEDIPVILENIELVKPFELLTEMYGYPKYNGIDPTPLFTPFFIVFFGFCITDAGYGIIISLLSYLLMRKIKDNLLHRIVKILFYGGLSSIIFGAITGGWFSNFLDKVGIDFLVRIKDKLTVPFLSPDRSPLGLLFLAWGFGVIQILYGIAINFVYNIKLKNYFAAFTYSLGSFAMELNLVCIVLALLKIIPISPKFLLLSLLGCMVVVAIYQIVINKDLISRLFWSIFANYSLVTGNFLGDILSYSRLFALGLATGLMAMAVNEICTLVKNIPVVGYIFALLLFVGGHVFNIIINVLGGCVHTTRLQFSEFFSKFYVPGGRKFVPFKEVSYLAK